MTAVHALTPRAIEPTPQKDRMELGRCALAVGNDTFMELTKGPHPLLKSELKALIERRPEVWARFKRFLHSSALPDR